MAHNQTDTQPQTAAQEIFAPETSLLDSIISESRVARSETERTRTRDLIDELVNQVLEGEVTPSKDLIAVLDSRIAEIDSLLSDQLNEIMHASEFQQLEASWRGLKYLTDQTETSTNMKIHMLNASKKDLIKDLKSASEFDQSALFKKVYEEEYGTFGGAPYGMMIGDYEFGRHPQDMYLLEQVSHVAAAAHAPFISSASAELFGWDSFTDMAGPRDLSKIFDTVEYAKWKSFRNSEDARLSSQLQYIFATSRIAHFMKAIMRDKVGSFASRQNVEDFLNEWLSQYVLLDDNAGQEAKAQYPLREARVEVAEVPGKPGSYKAVTFLRPHYQLDELTASLRLVSELPQSTRGS